jgi:hypothetical protein
MLTSSTSLKLKITSKDAENQTTIPTIKAKAWALIVTSQPKLTSRIWVSHGQRASQMGMPAAPGQSSSPCYLLVFLLVLDESTSY